MTSDKKLDMKKFLILLTALLCAVVTVFCGSYVVVKELEEQLWQNLEDVANQNALALRSQIDTNYQLIDSLSEEFDGMTEDAIEDKLAKYCIFLDEYGLKRFAFCFPDGTTYSTDADVTNLSYREFFKRGMEGKRTITGVLSDAIDGSHENVNVMTVPVFGKDGEVRGVFGLAYDAKTFNASLQIESFNGEGYSCVIDEDGQIMAVMGNSTLHLSHNLFSDLQEADERNGEAAEEIQAKIEQKSAGGGRIYFTEEYWYYGLPVTLMDGDVNWYLFTIIPADILDTRTAPIQRCLYAMCLMVGIFVLIGVLLTILRSREQQKLLVRYAYEDPLTGGANFARFCVNMEKRRGRQGYLIAADITNFNIVNIAAGKTAGDTLLREIWEMLTMKIYSDETAGHVRDDMFALFLTSAGEQKVIERMEEFSEQIHKRARELNVSGIHFRYGIYHMTAPEAIESAYSKAKLAREYARTTPGIRYALYDEMDNEKSRQDEQLAERFTEALVDKEFEVWYQPKYGAGGSAVAGSEALVRWREKDGTMISPGRFIPLFEKNGMITKLDEYMFRTVCVQQKKWLAQGKKVCPVSINISRASLYYTDVVKRYRKILEEVGLEPSYIQLEVTESAIEGKSDICAILEQFRAMGICILMDDFGTGYSSLATLNLKCFDTLKLDKSLIDHIGEKDGETLLFHVINMGRQLGLHITAEGVESSMQAEYLWKLQCDDIQGYFFAKPMPVEKYEQLLDAVKGSGNE